MVHQVADEIRALKARVEAVHAQSPSAKEATALDGLNARLDAVKTETGTEIAELAGKVDRLQREVTTKLAKASERFDRPNHRVAAPRAAATKAPRGAGDVPPPRADGTEPPLSALPRRLKALQRTPLGGRRAPPSIPSSLPSRLNRGWTHASRKNWRRACRPQCPSSSEVGS